MVSAFYGGDDFFGIFGPGEGLRGLIVLFEVALDGGLEVHNAVEDTALEPPLGENGEEALDGIEPCVDVYGPHPIATVFGMLGSRATAADVYPAS